LLCPNDDSEPGDTVDAARALVFRRGGTGVRLNLGAQAGNRIALEYSRRCTVQGANHSRDNSEWLFRWIQHWVVERMAVVPAHRTEVEIKCVKSRLAQVDRDFALSRAVVRYPYRSIYICLIQENEGQYPKIDGLNSLPH
jgi:hypothetical protein